MNNFVFISQPPVAPDEVQHDPDRFSLWRNDILSARKMAEGGQVCYDWNFVRGRLALIEACKSENYVQVLP